MKEKIDIFGCCPKCKKQWAYKHEGKKYSKLIGIEIREKYDGVSLWLCPFCKTKFDRWTGEEVKNG